MAASKITGFHIDRRDGKMHLTLELDVEETDFNAIVRFLTFGSGKFVTLQTQGNRTLSLIHIDKPH